MFGIPLHPFPTIATLLGSSDLWPSSRRYGCPYHGHCDIDARDLDAMKSVGHRHRWQDLTRLGTHRVGPEEVHLGESAVHLAIGEDSFLKGAWVLWGMQKTVRRLGSRGVSVHEGLSLTPGMRSLTRPPALSSIRAVMDVLVLVLCICRG